MFRRQRAQLTHAARVCNHRTVRQAIVVHDFHVVVLTIRQFVLAPQTSVAKQSLLFLVVEPTLSCNSLARMTIFPSLHTVFGRGRQWHAFSWFMRKAHAPVHLISFVLCFACWRERERPTEHPSPEGLSRVRLLPPPPWKGPKIDCIFTWRNRQNYRGYFTFFFFVFSNPA